MRFSTEAARINVLSNQVPASVFSWEPCVEKQSHFLRFSTTQTDAISKIWNIHCDLLGKEVSVTYKVRGFTVAQKALIEQGVNI